MLYDIMIFYNRTGDDFMEYIGIRLSQAEKQLLKNSALKAGISLSDLVRSRLFVQEDNDDFINFKAEQMELNRELIELLKAIHTQSRIGTNITARMYTSAFPDVARDEIKKVKDKFLGGENNA